MLFKSSLYAFIKLCTINDVEIKSLDKLKMT